MSNKYSDISPYCCVNHRVVVVHGGVTTNKFYLASKLQWQAAVLIPQSDCNMSRGVLQFNVKYGRL